MHLLLLFLHPSSTLCTPSNPILFARRTRCASDSIQSLGFLEGFCRPNYQWWGGEGKLAGSLVVEVEGTVDVEGTFIDGPVM